MLKTRTEAAGYLIKTMFTLMSEGHLFRRSRFTLVFSDSVTLNMGCMFIYIYMDV